MLTEKENKILDMAEDLVLKRIEELNGKSICAVPLSTHDLLYSSVAMMDRILQMKNQYNNSHSDRSDGSQPS